MDETFEGMIFKVISKDYATVAEDLYCMYKEEITAKSGSQEGWIGKIEKHLSEEHEQQLKDGLFSRSQKEMGAGAVHDTIVWLEKELGVFKGYERIAFHL